MRGPEHYLAAEQWLRWAEELYRASDHDDDALPAGQLAASIAQAHATLAQTTAELDIHGDRLASPRADLLAAWDEVMTGPDPLDQEADR